MVVVAFVVPLAGAAASQRRRARGHHRRGAVALARHGAGHRQRRRRRSRRSWPRPTPGGPRSVSVILADGSVVGAPAPTDSLGARARSGEAFTTVASHGAREVFLPVRRPDGTVSVVRVVVSKALLTHGVTQAWLILAALGMALVLLAVGVTDRLVRPMVASMERLSDGHAPASTGRARRSGRPRRTPRDRGGRLRGEPLGRPDRRAAPGRARGRGRRLASSPDAHDRAEALGRGPPRRRGVRQGDRGPGPARAVRRRGDPGDAPPRPGPAGRERPRRGGPERASVLVGARRGTRAGHDGRPAFGAGARGGADPTDLDAAIDALLDNVFAYTDPGVEFSVRVAAAGKGRWSLSVEDAGADSATGWDAPACPSTAGAAPDSGSTSPVAALRVERFVSHGSEQVSVARSSSCASASPTAPWPPGSLRRAAAPFSRLELGTAVDAARATSESSVSRLERHRDRLRARLGDVHLVAARRARRHQARARARAGHRHDTSGSRERRGARSWRRGRRRWRLLDLLLWSCRRRAPGRRRRPRCRASRRPGGPRRRGRSRPGRGVDVVCRGGVGPGIAGGRRRSRRLRPTIVVVLRAGADRTAGS